MEKLMRVAFVWAYTLLPCFVSVNKVAHKHASNRLQDAMGAFMLTWAVSYLANSIHSFTQLVLGERGHCSRHI
jgi:hypothetical protein